MLTQLSGQINLGDKPRICFVALNAYNVLSGREDLNHTGGAEVQQLQIASWLVRKGYPVSFITLSHSQQDGIICHGIKVHKAYAREEGIWGLRFIYPRWTGLWAAMARANADVYYQRTAECETGQVALWCRLYKRKFIFAVANDSDCVSSLYALKAQREKMLYRIGLRLANAVTAQTKNQQRMLLENMKTKSTLVRNCGMPSRSSSGEFPIFECHSSLHVLWVGRISKQKRLEWYLDVAERCPDITFGVIGAANIESDYASGLINRAVDIPNVKMHGYVPYGEMSKLYQCSNILCCTSAYEGFPNTFLEAWALGIPVVSTFDPDDIIVSENLGWVTQNVEGVVTCLRKVSQSMEIWKKASIAARQYYKKNLTQEAALPKFEQLLLNVCKSQP